MKRRISIFLWAFAFGILVIVEDLIRWRPHRRRRGRDEIDRIRNKR